ncbi:MAG: hypothetical protein AAFU77_15940 [Myxococcota bacterium]
MPQADLYFSSELPIDPADLLSRVESVIANHDPSAGECKGRAIPVAVTHHRHLLLHVAVLEKPHRTADFMHGLKDKLAAVFSADEFGPCVVSVELRFQSPYNTSVRFPPGSH